RNGETPDDPPGREEAHHDHHPRLHQLRRSGADAGHDGQDPNRPKHETGSEDEGEIEYGRFENLHLQLAKKDWSEEYLLTKLNPTHRGFDTMLREAYIEIHRTAPLAGLHFCPVL